MRGFAQPQVVLIDVTETPIEHARLGGEASPPNSARPKRRQRQFYSGKKKRHTLKCQKKWLSKAVGKSFGRFSGIGRRYDFKLYQASGVSFASKTESLQRHWVSGHSKVAFLIAVCLTKTLEENSSLQSKMRIIEH